MPKVSILIPCYNAKTWISQAIRSALDQTHADKEVIVVDDGSTDGSLEVIKSFGDQIRWETGPNRGGNVARNRLLELSSGSWLQYLDADDYLEPDKIKAQLENCSDHTDVIYSPTIWLHLNENGNETSKSISKITEPFSPWRHLILWELPQTGGSLWRKSAVIDAGRWRETQPCCQEHELYFRMLAKGAGFQFFPVAGAVYRQWSNQTVCRQNPSRTIQHLMEIIQKCEHHLDAHDQLTPELTSAIAETRYRNARTLYSTDRTAALNIATQAQRSAPLFTIQPRDCFPRFYCLIFRCLGFRGAELLASFARIFKIK